MSTSSPPTRICSSVPDESVSCAEIHLADCAAPPALEATCTGTSAGLSPAQCAGWQQFFDASNVAQCTYGPGNFFSRTDPCAFNTLGPCKGGDEGCPPGVYCEGDNIINISIPGCFEDPQKTPGSIGPGLAALTNLRNLYMPGNNFTGSLDALSELTNLEYIFFPGNLLTSIGDLSRLTNLRWLNLAGNGQLSGSLGDLSKLTSLTQLILSCNSFSGPAPSLPIAPGLNSSSCIFGGPKTGCHGNQWSCPLPPGAADKCGGSCK